MPKYFFHFKRRHIVVRDEIGIELEDRQAAIREAHSAIAQLVRDDAGDENKYHLESVLIQDEFGKQLETISLKQVAGRAEAVVEAQPVLRRILRRG